MADWLRRIVLWIWTRLTRLLSRSRGHQEPVPRPGESSQGGTAVSPPLETPDQVAVSPGPGGPSSPEPSGTPEPEPQESGLADSGDDERPAGAPEPDSVRQRSAPGSAPAGKPRERKPSVESSGGPSRSGRKSSTESEEDARKDAARRRHIEAVDLLRRRSAKIREPYPVASLAHEVKKEIGPEGAKGWFGYGRFWDFLIAALPNAKFDAAKESLLPSRSTEQDHYPPAVLYVWSVNSRFPRLEIRQWKSAYEFIEGALGFQDVRRVRTLHERLLVTEGHLGRSKGMPPRELRKIAWGISSINELEPGMKHLEIENAFIRYATPGLRESGLPEIELEHAEAWLRGYAQRTPYLKVPKRHRPGNGKTDHRKRRRKTGGKKQRKSGGPKTNR